MPNTSNRSYPYPASTAAPNVPADMQALANAIDTDVQTLYSRRVGTTTATSNGGTTSSTTELAGDQVTITAVSGKRYHLRWEVKWTKATATDRFVFRIRTGSGTGGTELQSTTEAVANTGATWTERVDVDWVAGSSGSQTFTGTIARISGSSAASIVGSATQVREFTVERIN